MKEKIKILKKGEFFKNEELEKNIKKLNTEVTEFLDELDDDDPEDQKIMNELYLELAKYLDSIKKINNIKKN